MFPHRVDPKGPRFVFCCITAYSLGMQQKTVTFRAPGNKIKALDALAALQQRDRSFVLNQAVDQYLAMNEYYREQIAEGMRDIRKGDARQPC